MPALIAPMKSPGTKPTKTLPAQLNGHFPKTLDYLYTTPARTSLRAKKFTTGINFEIAFYLKPLTGIVLFHVDTPPLNRNTL
jgi:hypothetical protein